MTEQRHTDELKEHPIEERIVQTIVRKTTFEPVRTRPGRRRPQR